MVAITSFDIFNLPETPNFILCNPNREQLYALGGISERKYKARFNGLSELLFRADEYINNEYMDYYPYLSHRRQVYVEELGYFIIAEVSEKGDGIQKYKEVTCLSLEATFIDRHTTLFDSYSVKLYDQVTPSGTLLDTLLDYVPGWSVGDIDAELLTKRRTFTDITDETIYKFLTTAASEAYECVFIFDTVNKTISAKTIENATTETDIYISYDNLIQNIEVNESTDELVTALTVYGAGELSIRNVNPLGSDTMYDFSYFTNNWEDWMSEGLKDKIIAWDAKVSASQILFSDTLTDMSDGYAILAGYTTTLETLQLEYAALEQQKLVLIQAGESLAGINSDLASKQSEIDNAQNDVDTWEAHVSGSLTTISNIQDEASLSTNFTGMDAVQLQPFIVESTYINDNFVVFDTTSSSSIQQESQNLYNQAENVLARISEPRYTFSVDSVNFLRIKEFETFIDQFKLGAIINLEIKEGVVVYPVLLGFDIDYDNPENFTMIFGNRLRLDDEAFQFSDLMAQTISSGTKTRMDSQLWKNWNDEYKSPVRTFITSALNSAVNNVTSGSNQDILIDHAGLRGRQMEDEGNYSSEQLWMVNNMLAFTDDNWETAKMAIGKFETPTSGSAWGIIANYLVGTILIGEELLIENEDSSFIVSGSQATLSNSDFIVNNTSASIIINPIDGFLMQNNSGSVLKFDISGNGIIGGWTIGNTKLYSSEIGLGSADDSSGYAFWAGNNTPASAEFRVTHAGALVASNANVTGAITATSGTIGGWTIGGTKLYSSEIGLGSSSDSSGYAFWAGNNTPASAEFRVTHAGALTATSGNIGGWTIGSDKISSSSNYAVLNSSGKLDLANGGLVIDEDGILMGEPSSVPTWPSKYGVNWKYDSNRYAGIYGHLESGDQTLYLYNYSTTSSYDSKISMFSNSYYNGYSSQITADAGSISSYGSVFLKYATSGLTGTIRFRAKSGLTNAIESGNYDDSGVQNLSITGRNGSSMTTLGIGASTTYMDGKACVVTTGADANRYSVAWNSSSKELIFYSSDKRLKENISYNIDGLSILEKLKPVNFNFIDNKEKKVGFIAQDTIKASPLLAWNNQEEDTWGLSGWDAFSAILVKSVQEQQKIIEKLENRINILEKQKN